MKNSTNIRYTGLRRVSNRINIYLLWILSFYATACGNFLDVIPDNIPTVDHAFKTRYQAEAFLYGCFSFLPNFADAGSNPALLGGDETWYIDPVDGMSPRLWYIARGAQGTNEPLANYWASKQNSNVLNGGSPIFTALSDCNIFLENIHIPYDLGDEERNRWIAEVKFLKAFYHFWLFRMYGPIPLIKENLPLSAKGEEAQRYREPVDDVVDYIVSLIDEAIEDLPPQIEDQANELGRPTKAIALAVKAQTLTLAASPLFNGNTDYAGIVDERNIELFPQTYSQEKWERAAAALKDAIDAAHEGGHKLYDFTVTNPSNAAQLNEKTILAMQVRGAATEQWNEEIIWGDSETNTLALQRACHPVFFVAQNGGGLYRTFAPTLQVVEQFYTKNGVPIEEDKDWVGVDPMEIKAATAADKYYIRENHRTIQLHFDREARFYGSIMFDGGTLYGNSRITSDNNMWVTDLQAGKVGGGANPVQRYPSTGYICKKWLHFRSAVPDNSNSFTAHRYAFPIIRLADLYLMYAEALNESLPAPTAEVYKYIDEVRVRTGLKGVVESWQDYAIDANKPLRQEGMREIIRRERLNELAFEGARFWDLKRWKLAETYMNRPVRGLNIRGETPEDFYQETEIYPLTYKKRDYLWPIKQSTLLTNRKLVQNIGWN
ncbi:RagB/SusD family nutrient uptake outer membrane protein [Sphingobacterium sp. SGG-5]|uniref:RagB/SusD family nutrient uptake outer membrane protein n=1 Tax=Sphingobacterium sp. SGG-5 TaxID=2710881 RepID=UPI0013EA839D|nr:RagB/SusD family nutrient uptake outer membrane protein [Sphingobacterium sp. SGG-5]NGM60655.1 RagB/SusD family nutrient uptake outer membrane protein [Sphingobacterium sp. SGG-5]